MKILISGATNGMGKGVAKTLAGLDGNIHEIIILCRSKTLGEATIQEIKKETLNNKVSIILCDLTRLRDVKNAIEEIQHKHAYLDAIFINAGLGYAAARVETENGMDSHFQVNYMAHFMLLLNLLSLLEKSEAGGRVIFNVTEKGEIFWDDLQMRNKWGYEDAIHQAMAAKRMFLIKLHNLYREKNNANLSFIGFQIAKTVWSNQLAIIPVTMRIMATLMKFMGTFISIEECGEIMAPLFTENQAESLKKSGKFITWKKNKFLIIEEDMNILNNASQDKLWDISLKLCADEKTAEISKALGNHSY
jgi:hypothetical protein